MGTWVDMETDEDIIDLGPIKLERDGKAVQVINRWGEEVVAYVEAGIDDADWAELRRRVAQS